MSTLPRLALLALLGIALWNPALPWRRAPLDLVALIDDSLSVDREAVAERWRRIASSAGELPPEGRLSVLRFASGFVVEAEAVRLGEASALLAANAPPRTRPLDRTQTHLELALEEALARVRSDQPTALLLVSDGVQTRGDAEASLRALETAGIPVIAAPVSAAPSDRDSWIESLQVPSRARVGERIPIAAALASNSQEQGLLRLRVNGEEVAVRPVELQPGRSERVEFELPSPSAGLHRLEAHLESSADPRPQNNTREALVQVEGLPRLLYLTAADAPPLLRSLRGDRWEVSRLHPSEFEDSGTGSLAPALVVLDDIAVDDMPGSAWRTLAGLVTHESTGLLVLGGPHSFGAGGYRRSLLEELLPVTAEARDPRSRAAIFFVIDSSGSMERDREGRERLDLARRAVLETLRSIPEGDLVGVSSFAVEPREILPLGRYPDPARLLSAEFPAASGGTRLRPALDHAVERLSEARADQRLLVLVTDGFVEGEKLGSVEREIALAEVELIVLAVGADVELQVLERLTAGESGTLLRVEETAHLPRLMRREVGARVEPAALGRFQTRPVAPLPFPLEAGEWPGLTGYMVSRARSGATVYLESDQGDPLFAAHHAGAGRVAALPAGLGSWTQAWSDWPGWGRFVGGLIGWLARPADSPDLHLRIDDAPQGLALQVDALSEDGEWSTQGTATLTAIDPSDRVRSLEMAARAPGRFVGTLPAPLTGRYRVAVRVGDQVGVRHVLRRADRELTGAPSPSDRLRNWQEAGLLEIWPERGRPEALRPASLRRPVRLPLLLVALAAYAALLVYEETRASRSG